MEIEAANAIRLFFPNPSLLMVYYEAIANALDADATNISIDISIQAYDNPKSLNIVISDNGTGFNDDSFDRFRTLLKPRDENHKGIGRLLFLDYFDKVEIESNWQDTSRHFTYSKKFNGEAPTTPRQDNTLGGSKLIFTGFLKNRIHSYNDLKPDALKAEIIDHFFPRLHQMKEAKRKFKITIKLDTETDNAQKEFFSESVDIGFEDLPLLETLEIRDPTIDAFDNININYHIKETEGRAVRLFAFNIDGRTIPVKLVQGNAIPPEYSVIFIVDAPFLNITSDSARQKLVLPEGLSEAELFSVLRRELGIILAEKIPKIGQKNTETRKRFEEKFPHLLGYFEDESTGLIERDEALNIAQQRFFKDQKMVLQSEHLSDDVFEKSLELSSRSLTEYVLYRDKIIQKLKATTEENSEADIHNLIVPRYSEFSQGDMTAEVYRNNAWLLDDKFMSFRTILSEGRMERVINAIRSDDESSGESGRPDITMIFSADPDSETSVDVVVIEVKKKTCDEKENQYVINQLLDRATKLAEHCPQIQRIWYYGVIQIDETMKTRLHQQKFAPLFSKGQVYYQEFPTLRANGHEVPTPVFILSYDAIVADAESRNHTFLEILRSSMKKFSTGKHK